MGELFAVLDEFVTTNPFAGGVVASLIASMLYAVGQSVIRSSPWFSRDPIDNSPRLIERSEHAVRSIAEAEKYAGKNAAVRIAIYSSLPIGMLLLGWFINWRIPISTPLFFWGIVFATAGLLILFSKHYVEGVMVLSLGVSVVLAGIAIVLNDKVIAGPAFLAFGVVTLAQGVAAAYGLTFGVDVGALAEETGATKFTRFSRSITLVGISLGSILWGISFLIDASDKGGFGLVGIGFGLILASLISLIEVSPGPNINIGDRPQEKEIQRPTTLITAGGVSQLLLGVAALSWSIEILGDGIPLEATFITFGFSCIASGVFSIISRRRIAGSSWVGVGLAVLTYAAGRHTEASWHPFLVALAALTVGAIGSYVGILADRHRMDEVSTKLGHLDVTIIMKDESEELVGFISWENGSGRTVASYGLDIARQRANPDNGNTGRYFETRFVSPTKPPELPINIVTRSGYDRTIYLGTDDPAGITKLE